MPNNTPNPKTGRITIDVGQENKEWALEQASKEDRSVSSFFRQLIVAIKDDTQTDDELEQLLTKK